MILFWYGELPNLQEFFVASSDVIYLHTASFLRLLRRMTNVKKLDLNLAISPIDRFVDGNDSKKNILDYMVQSKKFTFFIHSWSFTEDIINLPCNEYIQDTLKSLSNNQITL